MYRLCSVWAPVGLSHTHICRQTLAHTHTHTHTHTLSHSLLSLHGGKKKKKRESCFSKSGLTWPEAKPDLCTTKVKHSVLIGLRKMPPEVTFFPLHISSFHRLLCVFFFPPPLCPLFLSPAEWKPPLPSPPPLLHLHLHLHLLLLLPSTSLTGPDAAVTFLSPGGCTPRSCVNRTSGEDWV